VWAKIAITWRSVDNGIKNLLYIYVYSSDAFVNVFALLFLPGSKIIFISNIDSFGAYD
jgi:hypothetical protein